MLEEKAQAKKCEEMEGLLEEGQSVIEENEDGTATRDVGIILSAQKVEHYEIAAYGGLTTLAKTLGRDDIAEILAEEKETDELPTGIAKVISISRQLPKVETNNDMIFLYMPIIDLEIALSLRAYSQAGNTQQGKKDFAANTAYLFFLLPREIMMMKYTR